jgi:hypothetical protein
MNIAIKTAHTNIIKETNGIFCNSTRRNLGQDPDGHCGRVRNTVMNPQWQPMTDEDWEWVNYGRLPKPVDTPAQKQ